MTQRANDFIIWRAGTSVNWECTAQEIADEVKLTKQAVQKSCNRRGWILVHNQYGNNGSRTSVDLLITRPWLSIAGRT
jgi:hypothetical protein